MSPNISAAKRGKVVLFGWLGPSFDNYAMALQAALDGIGVAIGLRPYVEDDVAAGRLVAPFPRAVPKGRAWYLVYRPFRQDDPSIVALRDWLFARFKMQ
jgi:DNA-binding transcriptional LysR family regulator